MTTPRLARMVCAPNSLMSRVLCALVLVSCILPAASERIHHPALQPTAAVQPAGVAPAGVVTPPRGIAANAEAVHAQDRKIGLSFEPNVGQTNAKVKFLSRGSGYTLFLTSEEAVLSLQKNPAAHAVPADPATALLPVTDPKPLATHVLRMRLLDSNREAALHGLYELPARTNYFRGNNPRNWQTNITNFAKVESDEVFPGIDLIYYGNQGQLEYDFVLKSGADPRSIALQFSGAQSVHVDPASGDLVMRVGSDDLRFHKPVAYQFEENASSNDSSATPQRTLVAANYRVDAGNRVSFHLAPYDHSRALVIDPTLSYATYLGGSSNDYATSIAIDSSGSPYISGYTTSANFPVSSGALQSTCVAACATPDAFITKLDPTGSSIVYSTFLGGSRTDYANGIAIDPSGNAFLVGQTLSPDFPVTAGAFQTACGGTDCSGGDTFVAELDSTGSSLIYSTFLGGSGPDQGNAIALDASNNAFITGWTQSTNFPVTAGVFQGTCTCTTRPDAIVTEVNPTGTGLVYSSYLGGSASPDVGYAIVVDPSDNAYVAGYTQSVDFPLTTGVFQTTLGSSTAGFVTKVNPTGSALVYSTYLGGSNNLLTTCEACITSIAIDGEGNAYVAGLTAEDNFPTTPGAFQRTFMSTTKGHDAFITELNTDATALVFSTYLGGEGDDGATGIAVDGSGNVWLKGNTKSTAFPVTLGAFQTKSGGDFDHYVAEFNPGGTTLLYSSYIGGSSVEFGGATKMLAIDSQNPPNIYLTGYTTSTNYPTTPGAFKTTSSGANDTVVAKFVPSANIGFSPAAVSFGTQLVRTTSPVQTLTVTNTGNLDLPAPSIVLSGTNKADYAETNNCAGTIAPQGNCTVSLTFTPTLLANESALLIITDAAPNSPQNVSITGTGINAGPALTVTPSSLTFPRSVLHTTSASKAVTLTNTGSELITFSSLSTSGDFAQTNTCGGSLALNASCTVNVTFTPNAINNRTGILTITDNAPNSPQKVNLTGVGSVVSVSTMSLSFGMVHIGSTIKQTFTLTNTGTINIGISKVSITGTGASAFSQTNTCGTSVRAGATCTFTVSFFPSTKGPSIASVSIADNGGGSPQGVSLTGQGQ